jgi:hypothetical protein
MKCVLEYHALCRGASMRNTVTVTKDILLDFMSYAAFSRNVTKLYSFSKEKSVVEL